uniref:G protein gamma domain-containing protein n=1 Tax=Nelumbo nucifera TaxID=4432 RepID=A0A823A2M2_NELNU|nr:TPA_asm: hypothetical protein HUJ06_019103 [Nelumbo nucifera]
MAAVSAAVSDCSPSFPSLTPPCPKAPPDYPDLYGKRRELLKVQVLEREIGFLQEELKSVEDLQPASRGCKEVHDFVMPNPDPFIPRGLKTRRSHGFWNWLCGKCCFNCSWLCCFGGCSLHLEKTSCCNCRASVKWQGCCCLKKKSCQHCCILPALACTDCHPCNGCTSCCTGCKKVCHCSNCTKACCNPCHLCC